jgi:hydroxypyruvate isomerase
MFKASYNANGLRRLPLFDAIDAVARAGYDGIELSLHPAHIDPFAFGQADASRVRAKLERAGLEVCCLATGADRLLGTERFEPSLVHETAEGRARRIDLIRRGLRIAVWLGAPTINFASGIRRPDVSATRAGELLSTGIARCLDGMPAGVTLAIEPEPGFFVERNAEAIALIERVGSERLRLSQDLGHEHVVEDDYLASVERALPLTAHIHVEDIKGRVHRHEIPGDGDIDFTAFFDVLHRCSYGEHVSVELYEHVDAPEEALARSIAHLRRCATPSGRQALLPR